MQLRKIIRNDPPTVNGGAVTNMNFRDGHKWTNVFFVHRGGCLYNGEITLRDLSNGNQKQFGTISNFYDHMQIGDTCTYLSSIWDKHLAATHVDNGHEVTP